MSSRAYPSRPTALIGAAVVTMLLAGTLAASRPRRASASTRHRVVIVGAGFGGLQAATQLARRRDVALCVLDQHNHHLFQPLLYQVATAALAGEDIASPIRPILSKTGRPQVLMERVTGIDMEGRRVLCDGGPIPYDSLIIATGSEPSYFGHDDWREAAPGLKTLDDALGIRSHVLGTFEKAVATADDPAELARLLTFVLVGGGATGVEMAGAIAELARDVLHHDLHDLDRMRARIVLIEASSRVLPEFAPDLSQSAADALTRMGVEVRTATRVTGITRGTIHCGEEAIAAETILWVAGVAATPVAAWLGLQPDRHGRVAVGPDLRVPGHPEIFVIGDAATLADAKGRTLPGLAPVAKQQGGYVARAIGWTLAGRRDLPPFHYRDYGTLATIGRNKAVAEFGRVRLTGLPAWLMWAGAHIFFLIGFRNRFLVSAKWSFSYVTHERGARVIT